MAKKLFSILVAAGLVAGALIAPPAGAQSATEIPPVVQVEDPANDANFINDQDNITPAGHPAGDQATPADAGTVSDILKIWFSHSADNISAHILTQAVPPATSTVYFRLAASPAEGDARGCLRFQALIGGVFQGQDVSTFRGGDFARFEDTCNDTGIVEGELKLEEAADGGITTITVPRSASPLLVNGATVTGVYGISRIAVGQKGTAIPGVGGDFASFAQADNTKRGTDYVLAAGDVAAPPDEEPKKDKPKAKKAKKAKKKGKKGKKGKAKAAACAPFTPGDAGKDQPLVSVTDAATEEKPVEQTVTLAESLGDLDLVGAAPAPFDPSTAYFNIQVDSAAADAGLYVYLEFPPRRDYDLNLLHPDGSYAARSRGFNTFVETPASTPGHGGEPTDHSEKLVGIKTSDCGGWTLGVENWLGEGGDFAVKVWLGEAMNDPQAPGEETP